MQKPQEDADSKPFAESDYLDFAENQRKCFHDAGFGVVVVSVSPPSGRGPRYFIILVDGCALPGGYRNGLDAIGAANRFAARRRAGEELPLPPEPRDPADIQEPPEPPDVTPPGG